MRQEKEIDLPDWLDPEVWFDYIDHRRILKAPMSKRAKVLAINNLEKLRAAEDPRNIVDRSIENGWKGLFPAKEKVNSNLSIVAKKHNLTARPGESWEQFEQRVRGTR